MVNSDIKYAIIGSRSFNDYRLLKHILDPIIIYCIVSGGANGADTLAERYAKENNIQTEIYPADWNKYGKSAGYIRNKDIICGCDKVIAFWDGSSKGTYHSIKMARKLNKDVEIIRYMDYNKEVFL